MDITNGWPCQYCRGRGLVPDAADAPRPSLPQTQDPAEGVTLFAPSKQALHALPGLAEPGDVPAPDTTHRTPPV
jgi:hypothetical protein